MKTKIRTTFLIICFISIFVLVGATFTKCKRNLHQDANLLSSGYYICRKHEIDEKNSKNFTIAIEDLTDLGKEQGLLIIPSEIEGHQVNSLKSLKRSWYVGDKKHVISRNLKILYYHSDLKHVDVIFGDDLDKLFAIKGEAYNLQQNCKSLYFSHEYYLSAKAVCDVMINENAEPTNAELIIANVAYYYNYDNPSEDREIIKTFFIDDLDNEKIINIPPNPYRKNYTFLGWYKEGECINKWDFDNDIIPAKVYDQEHNYISRETILYAKWEEK